MRIGNGGDNTISIDTNARNILTVKGATNAASSFIHEVRDNNSSASNDRYSFVVRTDADGTNARTFHVTPGGQTYVQNALGIGTDPSVELDVVGDIEYTGTITDVSDARLKENIEPLNKFGSLLDRIDQIETVSFVMKDDEKRRTEFGVIAQQIENVFPELVHTADDDMGTKSVNYVGLIAPMIEATKELKAENDKLKTELESMTAQHDDFKATLADLQGQVDLLNKAAGDKVEKASFIPVNNAWLYLLLGMLGTLCIVLVMNRKPAKVE